MRIKVPVVPASFFGRVYGTQAYFPTFIGLARGPKAPAAPGGDRSLITDPARLGRVTARRPGDM
jgi:hypothetical protein